MTNRFDGEEAEKYLKEREQIEKENKENIRKNFLSKVIAILREEFKHSSSEVYLVGSIIRPYQFTESSDVDIVVKNYQEDRFSLWTRLEKKLERNVEVILFETCPFKEFILKEGLKVV